jgi:cytochrome c peroxidase
MRRQLITICRVVFVLLVGLSYHQAVQRGVHGQREVQRGLQVSPVGINELLWRKRIPDINPMSQRKIALGRALFFDKRLSVDGTVACATCHDPAIAFTDSKTVALGAGAKSGTRNTPTILNSVFSESLFWDGRAPSLEEQVKHPLLNSFEMGMESGEKLTQRLSTIAEYRKQFAVVFKTEGLTLDTVAKAIAAYERTLISANSPFDRFITGSSTAITAAQKRGWELFKGKAKCSECHSYSQDNPFFVDFKFHNTGVAAADALFEKLTRSFSQTPTATTLAHTAGFAELGRFVFTLQPADIGSFKTPTLRDAELTSPYMHDGSIKTLIDVVQFYNRGGNSNSHLDKLMTPLNLSDQEVNDLVQFIRALTSDDVLKQCQSSTPQTRTAVPIK